MTDGQARAALPGGVRIGTLGGFPLTVHPSVMVVAALVAWTLAYQVLPDAAPGYGGLAYWSTAVVAAGLFFGSLLAHELRHAVVARRSGLRVREVTVWLLGGIAFLEGEPSTPADDLRIAVAGPVASLAIGCGGFVTAAVLAAAGAPDLVVAAAGWLGIINVALAAFNLLPGAPLDGGRVLRAWLWRRTGDRREAARRAASAGHRLGQVLIGVGAAELFLLRNATGLWSAVLGLFVLGASRDEETAAVSEHLLAGVVAADVMTPDPMVVPAGTTVADVIQRYVLARPHSAYPVMDDTRVVGLVTLDGLRRVPPAERASTPVDLAMIRRSTLGIVPPTAPLPDVLRTLHDGTGRRVLVLHREALVGIIAPVDLTKAIEARALAGQHTIDPDAASGTRA